jgi:hypothetical protein
VLENKRRNGVTSYKRSRHGTPPTPPSPPYLLSLYFLSLPLGGDSRQNSFTVASLRCGSGNKELVVTSRKTVS